MAQQNFPAADRNGDPFTMHYTDDPAEKQDLQDILSQLQSILTDLQSKADANEEQPVSASSLPLPSGAATEQTLAAIQALVDALATEQTLSNAETHLGTLETVNDTIRSHLNSIRGDTALQVAPGGTLRIADTDPHPDLDVYWIVVLEDGTTFSALSASDVNGVVGESLNAGEEIISADGITDITLSAGSVLCYRAS